jgi:hypothetical protein
MAVYGDVLAAFPELMRTIHVWSAPNNATQKQNERTIRGVFMPTHGDRLEYQKYSNRGKAIQYYEDDHLFVRGKYASMVDIGDFFEEPEGGHIHRILGQMNLVFQGGYKCFTTERVTGTTIDKTEDLKVKEAQFA